MTVTALSTISAPASGIDTDTRSPGGMSTRERVRSSCMTVTVALCTFTGSCVVTSSATGASPDGTGMVRVSVPWIP